MFRFYRWQRRTDPSAAIEYLKSGESMFIDVEEICADLRYPLTGVRSLLEFACGYGRLTRFLVCRLPASEVTVADIDHSAVDFTHNMFQVKSFYSVAEADKLVHHETYGLIFVGSLFSHLAPPVWSAWLKRLYAMLSEGGILVFSTHGMNLHSAALDKGSKKANGFYFAEINETAGRLSTNYYGTAYVSETYVRQMVSSEGLGKVIGFYPNKLCEAQDVYAIRKEAIPVVPRSVF